MKVLKRCIPLQLWDDDIVNLFKDRINIHNTRVININQITKNQLILLFLDITEVQLDVFFTHRNGDEAKKILPHSFKSIAEFKNFIINKLALLNESDYDARIGQLKKSKIRIGIASKLFKVISTGSFNDTKYQLTAYIDMPIQATLPISKKKSKKQNPSSPSQSNKVLLLSPRIIEIKNI